MIFYVVIYFYFIKPIKFIKFIKIKNKLIEKSNKFIISKYTN
jgi:hypothetical protein